MALNGKTPAEACGVISQRWELVKEKQYWQVITTEITRSVEALKINAERLGLSVVGRGRASTTTNDFSEELPSVEALKGVASVCIWKK